MYIFANNKMQLTRNFLVILVRWEYLYFIFNQCFAQVPLFFNILFYIYRVTLLYYSRYEKSDIQFVLINLSVHRQVR